MNLKILLPLILTSMVCAQQAPSPNLAKVCDWPDAPHYKNTTTWGLGAGVSQGWGVHLRKWYNHHGFNISLSPWINVNDDEKDINIDIGSNYMYALWEGHMYELGAAPSRNMVFAYFGGHINYVRQKHEDYWFDKNDESKTGIIGGGIGLQMNLGSIQFTGGLGLASGIAHNQYFGQAAQSINNDAGYSYMVIPSFDVSIGYTFGWK